MSSPPNPFPPRISNGTTKGILASEEARRQLTTAHLALKRGQIAEAERALQEALIKLPADASAQEMLGDIRLAQEDYEAATSAYRAALEREPGRISAENKLARATLRQSENKRRQSMGMAYASEERSLMQTSGSEDGRPQTYLIILSVILPGMGQIFNGSFVKGGILLAIFALGALLFMMSGARPPYGAGSLLALAVMILDWLYAVVDAARAGT